MLRPVADVFATAALVLVLWVSCMSIGTLIVPRRARTEDASGIATWNRPGLAACVGLGALIALGGWGTLLHLPLWLVVGPFMVVGLALAAARLVRTEWRPQAGPVVTVAALTLVGFVIVALIESRVGRTLRVNTCDEFRAYLPMVNRLLDTNFINEPWSYRRLQNLGGFTYLQAIPVGVFGETGIGVAETVIAAVFLAGFFVSTGLRTTWARVAALAGLLVIPVLWVPRINTAPVLALVPLLLGAYAVTAELRVSLRAGDRAAAVRWGIAGGLLLAAVASVRTPGLPVGGLVVVLGVLTTASSSWRERLRLVGVAAGVGVAAIAGWLLAAWETVGTPLYPLIPGNANTSVPSERDPHALDSLSTALSHTFKYLNGGTYFWVAVAVLVVAVVAVVAHKLLPDAPLVVIVALVVIANILVVHRFGIDGVHPGLRPLHRADEHEPRGVPVLRGGARDGRRYDTPNLTGHGVRRGGPWCGRRLRGCRVLDRSGRHAEVRVHSVRMERAPLVADPRQGRGVRGPDDRARGKTEHATRDSPSSTPSTRSWRPTGRISSTMAGTTSPTWISRVGQRRRAGSRSSAAPRRRSKRSAGPVSRT